MEESCFLAFHNMASNIGKKPIQLADGVQVVTEGNTINVTGPKGNLSVKLPRGVKLEQQEGIVTVKRTDEEFGENFVGLTRAIVANMVTGVTRGFDKKLELSGVGYRARVDGTDLVLNVGYANPVKIQAPVGITFQVAEGVIIVSGINKELIGDVAAKIRAVRPPDPYKGKGIKYQNERLRKKVGKAAKAVGAAK